MLESAQAAKGTAAGQTTDVVPKSVPLSLFKQDQAEEVASRKAENEKLENEIRQAKTVEGAPKRFAADLFDQRQTGIHETNGGIPGDYVLGLGDRLQLNVFGSATFELPLEVDGQGGVVIPKVGRVSVAGMSLAGARNMIESKISQVFSRSTVDLSVTKLREVQVYVLGEVYKPGSYLVPSINSIVNILSLSGGPTAAGSFREIRILRAGSLIHTVDLYPLRSLGLGNLTFGFQNGDTVFVPLVKNQVRMEGAFTRLVAADSETTETVLKAGEDTDEQKDLKRNIRRISEMLAPSQSAAAAPGGTETSANARGNTEAFLKSKGSAETLSPADRSELEFNLEVLQNELKKSQETRGRNDKRVEDQAVNNESADQPHWFTRWLADGVAPVMLFEMVPGETVKDAVAFAGGFSLQGFAGSVSLRRFAADGSQSVMDIPEGDPMGTTKVLRGDVITALPLRGFRLKSVKVAGWARVQGVFSREDGQRVGDLLKRYNILLPDTYLERGELVNVLANGSKRFTVFNVARALDGDPRDNLVLQDRDEIDLFRIGDLRLQRFLKVVGPVERPGKYEFIEGMRASDLLFRAGVPLERANQMYGELARSRDGHYGAIVHLDLSRLLSTEGKSPVDLRDDLVNPLLRPDDQISVFTKADYIPHRSIILTGQVARPGTYDLDGPKANLRSIIARAGGLTDEAMPKASIFLRNMKPLDPDRKRASILAGMAKTDPINSNVNEILGRLNETKRNAGTTNGDLEPNPLLHGLLVGEISRLVVDFEGLLAGDPAAEVELQDGDEVIIPRRTDVAYVVGEMASPFAAFKVAPGMKVKDLIDLAGGYTRNADTWNIRLLKANGTIVDRWVSHKQVEPGDTLLVPQHIKRDVHWAEQLTALTPIAILINTFK